MDILTNLLACVGKPIYLLSVVVQTNVVPAHLGGDPSCPTCAVAISYPSATNHVAELAFGIQETNEIWSAPSPSWNYTNDGKGHAFFSGTGYWAWVEGFKTNTVPLFTNYVALPEPQIERITNEIATGKIIGEVATLPSEAKHFRMSDENKKWRDAIELIRFHNTNWSNPTSYEMRIEGHLYFMSLGRSSMNHMFDCECRSPAEIQNLRQSLKEEAKAEDPYERGISAALAAFQRVELERKATGETWDFDQMSNIVKHRLIGR